MKNTLIAIILLFVVSANSQTIDWQNAPLNPAAEYYTLNHYNLNGPVKTSYSLDFVERTLNLDFNKDGFLTEKLTSGASKSFRRKYEYSYSGSGKIKSLKETAINSKDEVTYTSISDFIYNKDGLIYKKISRENNYTTQFNYDNYKRLVSIKTINPDGSQNDLITFKYNEKGQLIEERKESKYGKYLITLTYEVNGDKLTINASSYKDGELIKKGIYSPGVLNRYKSFSFFNNPQVFEFTKDGHEAYKKSAIELSFDQYGNFRKRYSKIVEQNMEQVDITYYNGIVSEIQDNTVTDTGCVSGDCTNGYGQYKLENVTVTGFFENGKANGFAEQVYNNGDNYVGNFTNGERDGYGIYTWKSTKTMYYGEWKNNKINGYGYLTVDKNITEAGIYQDGKLITNLGQDYFNKKLANSCQGDCVDGYGVKIYPNKDSYVGFFKNGKPYKAGARRWKATNTFYAGQFDLNGEPTGIGHVSNSDYMYFGKFINAEVVGKAVKINRSTGGVEQINAPQPSTSSKSITTSNTNSGCISGDCNNGYGEYKTDTYTLKAIFKNGKANGYGLQTFEESGFYEGNFVNGLREGYGFYRWQNTGSAYTGQWKQGKQHGYGYYAKDRKVTEAGYYQNGKLTTNLLTQDFINNKKVNYCSGNCKDGFGMYFYSNGDIYFGFFSNSKRHHIGSYIWKSGNVYIGEYYNGKANGLGDENYKPADTRYFGSFTNGQRDGFGVYFTKTNVVGSYGIWSNGVLKDKY